jgi:hypothetical protein
LASSDQNSRFLNSRGDSLNFNPEQKMSEIVKILNNCPGKLEQSRQIQLSPELEWQNFASNLVKEKMRPSASDLEQFNIYVIIA